MIRLAAHMLGRKHTKESDRAVTDNHDGIARLHISCMGGEPAGAHNVGERQQTRHHIIRRYIGGSHQGAIGKRDAQQWSLRSADEFGVLAGRLIANLAVRTCVVGREERSDDKLARLDGGDCAADLLNLKPL